MKPLIFYSVLFIFGISLPFFIADAAIFRDLKVGVKGEDVRELQTLLNADPLTKIANDGPGSPGEETDYFGFLTKAAVIRFQEKYRSEVLTPAGLFSGSGFVGSLTRAKLSKLTGGQPSSAAGGQHVENNSVSGPVNFPTNPPLGTIPRVQTPLSPKITSLYPARVREGDSVTVHGEGFTALGNTVTLATGALSRTYTNLTSLDGKTITFPYQAPNQRAMTIEEIRALPADTQAQIEKPIEAAGAKLEDIVARPYLHIKDETELGAALNRNGKTIGDLDELFHVTITNINGSTENPSLLLRAARKIELNTVLSKKVKTLLSPLASVISPFAKKAKAQVPGGGLNATIVMVCTCGGGHLSYLQPIAGLGGLTYFYPGFKGVSGTSAPGGLYLGLFTPMAGLCEIYVGLACIIVPGNFPWPAQYGQTI